MRQRQEEHTGERVIASYITHFICLTITSYITITDDTDSGLGSGLGLQVWDCTQVQFWIQGYAQIQVWFLIHTQIQVWVVDYTRYIKYYY